MPPPPRPGLSPVGFTDAYLREVAQQAQTSDRMRGLARAELARRSVTKAAPPSLAVFTRRGKLLGLVHPDDLTPVLGGD